MLSMQMKQIGENKITYGYAIDFINNKDHQQILLREMTTITIEKKNMNIMISASK